MYKLLVALLLIITTSAMAQTAADLQSLKQQEAVMAPYAKEMIFADQAEDRILADSTFTRMFVKALRTPRSFDYPFDSVITVSKLYAPDSSFRIFTWQFERDESYFRQRGAIQMRTKDGSLKLFPLLDASQFTGNPTDSVRSNTNWIGAIYYNMIEKQYQGKKYYTLFGYDDNDIASTRKWVDILTFDDAGNPHFGGKYFNYPDDSLKPAQPAYRFCLEYKKDAKARINYDPEMDMIIFDHLVSETNHQSEKYSLIPDGDYEGFKWKDGKWNYVEKVFNYKLEDGQAPMPEPLKDDAGNSNEKILQDKSQKNERKKP